MSDAVYERAEKTLRKCEKVIDAGTDIGVSNRRVENLLELADKMGILERR